MNPVRAGAFQIQNREFWISSRITGRKTQRKHKPADLCLPAVPNCVACLCCVASCGALGDGEADRGILQIQISGPNLGAADLVSNG